MFVILVGAVSWKGRHSPVVPASWLRGINDFARPFMSAGGWRVVGIMLYSILLLADVIIADVVGMILCSF